MGSKKSTFVTYILWLLGGFLGLHLFYLRRDRHCFVWWATFGGYVGIGWFRDAFRIPEYVAEANYDKVFENEVECNVKALFLLLETK